MDRKKIITAVVCVSVALGVWLAAATTLTLPTPWKVNGSVSISVRPYDTILTMSAYVSGGTEMVSKLRVILIRQVAVEEAPGRYRCEIKGFKPLPGAVVTVTFEKLSASLAPFPAPRDAVLKATATIGSLIGFTSPAPDAHLSLSSTLGLNVAWNGGNPPYNIFVAPFSGPQALGKEVFSKAGIMGTNVWIPFTGFKAGTKYGIYLFADMEKFAFSPKADPASNFILRQSAGTYIYTE